MYKRLLVISALMFGLSSFADNETVNGVVWTFQIDNGKAVLNVGPAVPTETAGAVEIPSSLGECPVTTVYGSAFYNCHKITSVTIPETVTTFVWGNSICSNLTQIVVADNNPNYSSVDGVLYNKDKTELISVPRCKKTVYFPSTVSSIDYYAFYDCVFLTELTVSPQVRSVGERLQWCVNLTKINVPSENKVLKWENGVLYNEDQLYSVDFVARNITSLVLPSKSWQIYGKAFANCKHLTYLDASHIEIINNQAFMGCAALKTILLNTEVEADFKDAFQDTEYWNGLPDGLVRLGDNIVSYKGECIGDVVIPEGVKKISEYAFENCWEMESITFPGSLTNIEYAAFWNCSGLTELWLPPSLTLIGYVPFSGCDNLTTVTLPDDLDIFTNQAFDGCPALNELIVSESNKRYRTVEGVVYSRDGKTLLFAPRGIEAVTIQDTVTLIAQNAFADCSLLTSFEIPLSVTSIGYSAFSGTAFWEDADDGLIVKDGCLLGVKGNDEVTSVRIPEGVRLIAEGALSTYQYCANSIVIPGSVTEIPENLFNTYQVLRTVEIGEGAKSIGDYAFGWCRNLEYISLPSTMIDVSGSAFYGCTSLKTVVAADGCVVKSSGGVIYNRKTFSIYCIDKDLETLSFPEGMTALNDTSILDGCDKVKVLNLPSTMTYIWGGALQDCTSLSQINIAAGNQSYASENGIVYSKDGRTVTCIPPALGNVILKEGLETISYGAFQNNTNIVSVTLPQSLKTIYGDAFYGCVNLVSFTIPTSVTKIGSRAFTDTAWWNDQQDGAVVKDGWLLGLKGECLSAAVDSSCQHMCDSCFSWNRTIQSVSFGEGMTILPSQCFYGCSALTSVTLPSTLKTISGYAFSGCSALSSIKIPSGVEVIEYNAFSGCTGITSLSLPSNVKTIGYNAFANCTGLKAIVLPANLENLQSQCFVGCSSLKRFLLSADNQKYCVVDGVLYNKDKTTLVCVPAGVESLTIPETVVNLESSAFMGCTKLATVEIPDGVTYIPYEAFANCTSLTNVVIPAAVTSIAKGAFSNCTSLEKITLPQNLQYVGADAFDGTPFLENQDDGVVIIGGFVVGVKGECPNVVDIPEGTKGILREAFLDQTSLEYISVPSSVASIEYRAFAGCTSLKEVELPTELMNIGSQAFEGCSALENVVLPDALTYVDWEMFIGCSSLTNVSFGESVSYVGGRAFADCISLQKALLPDSVRSIESGAFSGCENLQEINLPDGLNSLSPDAFENCTKLIDVETCPGLLMVADWIVGYDADNAPDFLNIPDGCRGMAYQALYGCNDLLYVTIPGSLLRISDSAFAECGNLLGVEIAAGVQSIGGAAFSGCSNLSLFNIPDSVVEIGYGVIEDTAMFDEFDDGVYSVDGCVLGVKNGCGEEVVLPADSRLIATGAFSYWSSDVSDLRRIVLPVGISSVLGWTFSSCPRLSEVVFANTNVAVNSFAFSGCTNLVSVTNCGVVAQCKFDGWRSTDGRTDFITNTQYMYYSDDYTLYPVWKKSSCRVTVETLYGTATGSGDYDYGSIVVLEAPEEMFPWQIDDAFAGHHLCRGVSSAPVLTNRLEFTVYSDTNICWDVWQTNLYLSCGDRSAWKEYASGEVLITPPQDSIYSDGQLDACGLIPQGSVVQIGFAMKPGWVVSSWNGMPDIEQNATNATFVLTTNLLFSISFARGVYVPSEESGGKTIAVDESWVSSELVERYGDQVTDAFVQKYGSDFGAAILMPNGKTRANGEPMQVWEDFVAGTDPTNPESTFTSTIEIVGGEPIVKWSPDLNDDGQKSVRSYTTFGCKTIGGDWKDMSTVPSAEKSDYHFFKVTVEMP